MTIDIAALLIMDCLILGFTKMFALMWIYIIWRVIWNKKPHGKAPADQTDVVGLLMLAGLLMLIGYVAVYGEAENWWESPDITAAGILIPMILFAFITRAVIIERPLLHFGHFKKPERLASGQSFDSAGEGG
jgi:hypothetical protein